MWQRGCALHSGGMHDGGCVAKDGGMGMHGGGAWQRGV